MFEFIVEYLPVRSLLFLLFVIVLIVILIRPSSGLCFWKRREETADVQRKGFKKFSTIAAFAILVFSFVSMAAGLYVPSVPVWVFYMGYAAIWLSLPFLAGARSGLRGFVISIPTILLLLFILIVIIIPVPVIEKEYPVRAPVIIEEDDRLEDKNPPYVADFTEMRDSGFDGLCYFNKSGAVIGLDLSEVTHSEENLADKIFPTFRAAKAAARSFECDFLPSVDLVSGFTKYFDDRLLAAVEEHIHMGSSMFPGGKQGFLQAVLDELLKTPDAPGRLEATAYLATAIELGGGNPVAPHEVLSRASSYRRRFLDDPRNSSAVGLYTKSETLTNIFQRDRFLQKPFGTKFRGNQNVDATFFEPEGLLPLVRVAEVLQRDPKLLDGYRKFRRLAEKTCNPGANLDIEALLGCRDYFEDESRLYQALVESDAWKKVQKRGNVNSNTLGVAFWPFSYSKESRLMARLYQNYELPRTEVMNDLISAIKDGRLDLAPDLDSGWYDYQLHGLETLVLPEKAPEAEKLLLHEKYKKRLREAFESMLTKHRETHVKQLFQVMTLGIHIEPLPATPELSLEPTATHYLRTARAYRFLRDKLKDFFTENEMTGLKLAGCDAGLRREFDNAIVLFYGLYLTVCNDLGMVPKIEPNEIASLTGPGNLKPDDKTGAEKFLFVNIKGLNTIQRRAWINVWKKAENWLTHLDSQKFLDEDVRMIVPVLSNYQGTKVRNWTILGTRLLKIKAYYAKPPRVARSNAYRDEERAAEDPQTLLQKPEEGGPHFLEWQPKDYVIPVQVFAEVTLGPKPMTRTEFRKICDQYETKERILKALTASSVKLSRSSIFFVVALMVIVLAFLLLFTAGRQTVGKRG